MKKILILILLFNINFTITYSEADVFIQSKTGHQIFYLKIQQQETKN